MGALKFLSNMLREGEKESFGRGIGAIFLLGSFGLSMADGIYSLKKGVSALDAAASLSVTGWALYSMSKSLSIRSKNVSAASAAPEAPEPIEAPTT